MRSRPFNLRLWQRDTSPGTAAVSSARGLDRASLLYAYTSHAETAAALHEKQQPRSSAVAPASQPGSSLLLVARSGRLG